jgi:hypothetical protein
MLTEINNVIFRDGFCQLEKQIRELVFLGA